MYFAKNEFDAAREKMKAELARDANLKRLYTERLGEMLQTRFNGIDFDDKSSRDRVALAIQDLLFNELLTPTPK